MEMVLETPSASAAAPAPEADTGAASTPSPTKSEVPTNRDLGVIPREAASLLDELGLTITAEMLARDRISDTVHDDEGVRTGEDEDEDDEHLSDPLAQELSLSMVTGEENGASVEASVQAGGSAVATVETAAGSGSVDVGVGGDDDGVADEVDAETPLAAHRGPPRASVAQQLSSESEGEATPSQRPQPPQPISEQHESRSERRPSLLADLGVGFNIVFNPPGAKGYLMDSYLNHSYKPEAKDSDTQTLWEEIAPPPPPKRRKSIFEQMGDDLFVKSYRQVEDDEEEEEAIRRAVLARQPAVDPDRPNVAVECCKCIAGAVWMRCLRPISRLPCSHRVRKYMVRHYTRLSELPYLQTAFGWMSTHGGVLRYLCLASAAGGGLCAVLDLLFVEGAKGVWTVHYIDVLLLLYIIFAQAGVVLFELPPIPQIEFVHELANSWARFLTRLIGRGWFYFFLGSLSAAKFSEGSDVFATATILGVLGLTFAVLQMIAGGAMIYLGHLIQQRMAELQDKLNSQPAEKAKLLLAITKADPTRRGSIHIEQLESLSNDLQLAEADVERAESELKGPSGLIHLDEFQSWYADRHLNLMERAELEKRSQLPPPAPVVIPERLAVSPSVLPEPEASTESLVAADHLAELES